MKITITICDECGKDLNSEERGRKPFDLCDNCRDKRKRNKK